MILSSRVTHPLTRSYVVKLDLVATSGRGRIAGRLSHVVTGRQLHFTSADELIARLVEFETADRSWEDEA
jgi:hypothetical protein